MSLDKYNHFKDKYANTKPIQGRTVECRPIAQRRRDWEQVVKRYIVEDGALACEGQEAYGAHLYQTDCVMYMPNGDMYVKTGGWGTPTTAEYINRYISRGMQCYKKYNKVWITYNGNAYPIDSTKPTIFRFNKANDTYAVENPQPMHQKVIDRTKIKDAREKLSDFRSYAKMMLKLADGWISNDLVEQCAEPHEVGRDYWGRRNYKIDGVVMSMYQMQGSLSKRDAEKIYTAMCTEDDTTYPKLLCLITASSNALESRVIKTEDITEIGYQNKPHTRTITTREYQYDYKTVDNRINYIIKQACDVFTTKEIPIGKVVTNLI